MNVLFFQIYCAQCCDVVELLVSLPLIQILKSQRVPTNSDKYAKNNDCIHK